jgi:hypothetical protein
VSTSANSVRACVCGACVLGGVLAGVSGPDDGQEQLVGQMRAGLVGQLTGDDRQSARVEAVDQPACCARWGRE